MSVVCERCIFLVRGVDFVAEHRVRKHSAADSGKANPYLFRFTGFKTTGGSFLGLTGADLGFVATDFFVVFDAGFFVAAVSLSACFMLSSCLANSSPMVCFRIAIGIRLMRLSSRDRRSCTWSP